MKDIKRIGLEDIENLRNQLYEKTVYSYSNSDKLQVNNKEPLEFTTNGNIDDFKIMETSNEKVEYFAGFFKKSGGHS